MNAADQRELAGLIDKRLIATLGLRPRSSPGWGMLRAVKSGVFTSKAGERTTIKAGVTGVATDHWLAREYPEAFRVCDKRDTRSLQEHSRSLERVKRDLERGRTPASGRRLPRSGVLPPKAGGSELRLPGHSSGTRPLRLPR